MFSSVTLSTIPRPAPRPRFNRRGKVYVPRWYKQHVRALAQEFSAWLDVMRKPVCVYVIMHMHNSTNGDVDNIMKTILDALVAAGIIADDDWHHVPRITLSVFVTRDAPLCIVSVYEAEDLGV